MGNNKQPYKYILGTYTRKRSDSVPPSVRAGETAEVLSTVTVTKPGGPETECYQLTYADGGEGIIAISAVEPGEFIKSSN